ncbi:hypothetical protein ACFO9Q_01625 [Paenibacillus sp. GCM10023252]|uniref:hypothetical protein n=1 Tax=Paenibacillus sp. GCM10023252 TaxID=3252649 RepID=UPI00361BB742
MGNKWKIAFWLIWYAFLCGGMLALFATIPSLLRFGFSLLAIYIGIRFFRRFEGIGLRAGFIGLSVFYYLLLTLIIALVRYAQNPDAFNSMLQGA